MSELRCTCGFADKIEAALERIESVSPTIILDMEDKELRAFCGEKGQGGWTVPLPKNYKCYLVSGLLELADKVKPPKPKRRQSREGDIMQTPDGSVQFHKGNFHAYCKDHRNLTIEAEQAGEK